MLIAAPISWLYEKEMANLLDLLKTDSSMESFPYSAD